MKPGSHPKYLLAGVAVCLAVGIAWWWIALRSESQRPRAGTDTASPNLKDAPEHLAANSWEQRERDSRREEFNRILEAGVWPENCSNLLEFFRFLLDRDPALALKFYKLAPGKDEKRRAISIISGEWFERDPAATIQWITSDSWLLNEARIVVKSGVSEAIERLDFNRHDLGEVLAAISRWANAQPDLLERRDIESFRNSVMRSFGSKAEVDLILEKMKQMGLEKNTKYALAGRAYSTPTEVIAYYDRKGEEMPDEVANGLVRGRLEEHPDEAFGYLGEHQWQGHVYMEGITKDVMNRYLDTDSMAASASLSKMQPGGTKDLCIKAMAAWLSTRGSGAEIANWLPAIQDPKVKQAVEQLAR